MKGENGYKICRVLIVLYVYLNCMFIVEQFSVILTIFFQSKAHDGRLF